MKRTTTNLALLGLLALVGCGDHSMPQRDNDTGFGTQSAVSTVRIQIDGFRKSRSGAT